MSPKDQVPDRFVGLDAHKHYLVAIGVDAQLQQVLGPQHVKLVHLERWAPKTLSPRDALVIEASSNSFTLYDELVPHVHSVTIVHPPHVKLITRAQVMTDKIAALTLARLHAARLLPAVWVPSQDVRDQRALVAQRHKMVRLSIQAKNRLHAVLHRHHLLPPEGKLFTQARRPWWRDLPISRLEAVRVRCDLDTLIFAQDQIAVLDEALTELAAQDERAPFLLQLPGIGLISTVTLLAAIGDIKRFPSAEQLVGYAGLGSRVHDSGLTQRRGRITKSGRRDIRATVVEAAHVAARVHPHWQAERARLEPRLGYNKTIVAIARKLLVAVWHVLNGRCADRFAQPQMVARKFLNHAYRLGRARRPDGQSAAAYVRQQLDRLALGADLTFIQRDKSRTIPLPPSRLNGEVVAD